MMNEAIDQIYREFILEHWRNPQNKKLLTEFDFEGHLVNSLCGDAVLVRIKFTNGKVKDVGFDGEGCALSLASASILTEHIKSKTKKDLLKMEGQDVLDLLGIKLTGTRLKCVYLSLDAIKTALSAAS